MRARRPLAATAVRGSMTERQGARQAPASIGYKCLKLLISVRRVFGAALRKTSFRRFRRAHPLKRWHGFFGCPSAFTRCVTASVPAALLLAPQLPMPVAAVPVKADAGPEFLK